MTVVFDVDRTVRTTHTVTMKVAGAPQMDAHLYYKPGMMYQPERLVAQWDAGEEPASIGIHGICTDGMTIKRGFGLKQAPPWIRRAVWDSIEEASTWDWFQAGSEQTVFKEGDTVRVNTPGESHHDRTGTVVIVLPRGRVTVDLGDARWMYLPGELIRVEEE